MGSACSNCTTGETESEINTVSVFHSISFPPDSPSLTLCILAWYRQWENHQWVCSHHLNVRMECRPDAISIIMGTDFTNRIFWSKHLCPLCWTNQTKTVSSTRIPTTHGVRKTQSRARGMVSMDNIRTVITVKSISRTSTGIIRWALPITIMCPVIMLYTEL